MIKVVMADDQQELRIACKDFLSKFKSIEIVGICGDGKEVLEKVRDLQPDIVLMDINMKNLSGIEATRIISKNWPMVKVIGVSAHNGEGYVRAMIDSGASGYVTKSVIAHELVRAIHTVHEGKSFVCEELSTKCGQELEAK
jgi:DNA-binding NarL/FixJ family response regulator